MATIFFDVYQSQVIKVPEKPTSALNLLYKIKNSIEFDENPPLSDLKKLAIEVKTGFDSKFSAQKSSDNLCYRVTSFFQNLPGNISLQTQVDTLYRQILDLFYQKQPQLPEFPFSDEVMLIILKNLNTSDSGRLARVCKQTQRLIPENFLPQARALGYPGNDKQEGKEYLQGLYQDVKDAVSQGLIPQSYLVHKVLPNGSSVLNIEETLKKIKNIKTGEVFNILHKKVITPAFAHYLNEQFKGRHSSTADDRHAANLGLEIAIVQDLYWNNFQKYAIFFELLIRLGGTRLSWKCRSVLDKAIQTNHLPIFKACIECISPPFPKERYISKAKKAERYEIVAYLESSIKK